jgi:hypothetical protein
VLSSVSSNVVDAKRPLNRSRIDARGTAGDARRELSQTSDSCTSGHVSDTIAAPLVHSPPMPSPSKNRNTPSIQTLCARPHAAVNTE